MKDLFSVAFTIAIGGVALASACGGSTTSNGAADGGAIDTSEAGSNEGDAAIGDGDAGASAAACASVWTNVTKIYPSATSLGSCDGVKGGAAVAASLMNLTGVTIDNAGTTMQPCVEAKCDAQYVYVASNALPHYDFIQTTPNALVAGAYVYRLPLTPQALSAPADAKDAKSITGCSAAYSAYVGGTAGKEKTEPSGFCGSSHFYDDLANSKRAYYTQIACFNGTGFLINGVPVFGPNEAQVPDAFGDPVYYWPSVAGETYIPTQLNQGAALDLCGGHTASTMHYHGAVEACFAKDASGAPANSYVSVANAWDFQKSLTDDCTSESPIVGYSFDGYPIRGSCVCVEHASDGSCKTVKPARSSWVYAGLGAWGDKTAADLSNEGKTCTQTSECCTGTGTCKFKCSHAVFDDATAAGGTVAAKRCVLLDYSYCTHAFVDRTATDVSAASFVYLDRCNGFESDRGYEYHAVTSFPYVTGCMHGESATTNSGTTGMMGGMGGMGMGGHP